jgi:hypothetical protein
LLEDRLKSEFNDRATALKALRVEIERLPLQPSLHLGGFEVSIHESAPAILEELRQTLFGAGFLGIFNPQLFITPVTKNLIKAYLEHSARTRPQIREFVQPGPLST